MTATALLKGKGYRVASKAAGDDTTRCRFVRVDQGQHGRRRVARQPRFEGTEAAFIREGRAKFTKAVVGPLDKKNLLVSGHNNIKIGRDVRKGRLRGYWIYTLTLEERKTCPSSCQHWQTCYGNNMPFALRVKHDSPFFLPKLRLEVNRLCTKAAKPHTQQKGILIRLHALGDFYSEAYVEFWRAMLQMHDNLAIYGYTARSIVSAIGFGCMALNAEFPDRCFIRFSNAPLKEMATVSIGSPESCPSTAFVCPEQTGKSLGCDYCGACWGTKKNVAFLEH